jgi:hypothetical protein
MLSAAQIKTLKMAQRQAGIGDDEYREHLGRFGVASSKDPALGDDALDAILSLFEAIYWRGVKEGRLQAPCTGREIFRQEGYWAAKNPSGNTSRDRYTGTGLQAEIERTESSLYQSGCGLSYVAAIRNRVCRGLYTPPQQRAFLAALQRTLAARQRKHSSTASTDPVR